MAFQPLWIEDIQAACDVLRGVWDRTGGADGARLGGWREVVLKEPR